MEITAIQNAIETYHNAVLNIAPLGWDLIESFESSISLPINNMAAPHKHHTSTDAVVYNFHWEEWSDCTVNRPAWQTSALGHLFVVLLRVLSDLSESSSTSEELSMSIDVWMSWIDRWNREVRHYKLNLRQICTRKLRYLLQTCSKYGMGLAEKCHN
jgi:hypothetical protein